MSAPLQQKGKTAGLLTLKPTLHSGGPRPPRVPREHCNLLRGSGANPNSDEATARATAHASMPPHLRKTAADLDRHNQQVRPSPWSVSALFLPACQLECHTISLRGSTSRNTSVQSKDQCGVHRHLCATSDWQTVNDDLKSATVDCHFTNHQVVRTRPPASLQMRAMMLSRAYPRLCQASKPAHKVPDGGHKTATMAKTSEQHNAEEVRRGGRLSARGGHHQRCPCFRTSLRPDQCARLVWQTGEQLSTKFTFDLRACFMLPSSLQCAWFVVFRLPQEVARHVQQRPITVIFPVNSALHWDAAWRKGDVGLPSNSVSSAAATCG